MDGQTDIARHGDVKATNSAELRENRGDKLIQMLGERRIDPKTQKNSYQNSFFLFVGISIVAKQLQNFILRAFFARLDRISNIMIILRHIFNHAMTQFQSHYDTFLITLSINIKHW